MGKTEILLVHRNWILEMSEFPSIQENIDRLRQILKANCKYLDGVKIDYFVSNEYDDEAGLFEASIWINKKDETKLFDLLMAIIKAELEQVGESGMIMANKENRRFNAFDLEETYKKQSFKHSKKRHLTP